MIITLSTRLKELRLNKNLNQEQVGKLIGVNKSAISAYENDTRQPSYDILLRLADLYRVSTDYLLGHESGMVLNMSGLTAEEAALISGLIESMTKKNEILNNLE